MSTLSASRPTVKPARKAEKPPAPVSGVCRWVERPVASPDSLARRGVLQINGVEYLVAELLCPETALPLGWTLTRPAAGRTDAASYAVLVCNGDLMCDCPDATYRPDRPGQCKHCRALSAALTVLDRARVECPACADRGYVPVAVAEVAPCPDCCNLTGAA
jgi:hypothetical protein